MRVRVKLAATPQKAEGVRVSVSGETTPHEERVVAVVIEKQGHRTARKHPLLAAAHACVALRSNCEAVPARLHRGAPGPTLAVALTATLAAALTGCWQGYRRRRRTTAPHSALQVETSLAVLRLPRAAHELSPHGVTARHGASPVRGAPFRLPRRHLGRGEELPVRPQLDLGPTPEAWVRHSHVQEVWMRSEAQSEAERLRGRGGALGPGKMCPVIRIQDKVDVLWKEAFELGKKF